MKNSLQPYFQLMRLDKPIGTLLLLWPTLWALWLAGNPTPFLVIIFICGVFIMRAAGCVINDYADRHVDGYVARTQYRPLASQRISVKQAKILFTILVFIAFLLVLTLNQLTIWISVLALLTAMLYPFMKRFTHLPQLVLGIAFSWGIPMAYAASIAEFPVTCWILCVANIAWTIAYDTQYAMTDREDDLKIGIKSTAILFGQYDKLIIGLLQLLTLFCFIYIGWLNNLSVYYFGLLVFVFCLFTYQQKLISHREPTQCFRAFLNNNYVGLLVFIGILIG